MRHEDARLIHLVHHRHMVTCLNLLIHDILKRVVVIEVR